MREHFSINQINEKEYGAFQKLYTQYYKILVLYSMQFVESQEIAEDIVQELFADIWEKNTQFISEMSFLSYLYNSIRNSSIDHLRHMHIEEEYIQKIMHEHESYPINEEKDEDLFETEIYHLLFQLIDELPARCKEVMMKAMEGKKNEEIAQTLDISVTTVKTYKKRSLEILKKKMSAYNFFVLLMFLSH
jgi:RNA polymerase sigma-70 factor (family 1)